MRSAVAFALAAAALAAPAPPAPAGAPGTRAALVFADEFDGPALDRSKWNVEVSGAVHNNEQQVYVDSAETLAVVRGREAAGASGGALAIRPRFKPGSTTTEGKRLDFVSGRINTRGKFEFMYGTAAARMKLPAGAGFWPAFWILGTGRWPDTGEIDVMEYVGEPDWTSVAIHGPGYSGDAGIADRSYFPRGRDATAWHVYSVDWAPDRMLFMVDGGLVFRATRPMAEFFGPWVFDNKKYLILNLALGGGYPLKTNGVKAPYPGLPEATVRRIKDGEGTVLVDWVRVTAR